MNVSQGTVTNAANLALFMVAVLQVLMSKYRQDDPQFRVLDLKAIYTGYPAGSLAIIGKGIGV